MTGPEHYREAEQRLAEADRIVDPTAWANTLRAAQVHATLALAATTALGTMRADDRGIAAWLAVAGGTPDTAVTR